METAPVILDRSRTLRSQVLSHLAHTPGKWYSARALASVFFEDQRIMRSTLVALWKEDLVISKLVKEEIKQFDRASWKPVRYWCYLEQEEVENGHEV